MGSDFWLTTSGFVLALVGLVWMVILLIRIIRRDRVRRDYLRSEKPELARARRREEVRREREYAGSV